MQTIRTKEFNAQYPLVAFDNSKGWVTFNDEFCSWGTTKPLSIAAFNKAVTNKIRQKELNGIRAINKQEADKALIKRQVETALASGNFTISVTPKRDRFDVTYKVGGKILTRNLSREMLTSLLNLKQIKGFEAGRMKAFTIDKYDFTTVIVAGGRRSGVKN